MAKQINSEKEVRLGLDKPNNNIIYGASIASILLSLLTLRRSPSVASFLGLWAPTILGFGILMKENQLLERTRQAAAY